MIWISGLGHADIEATSEGLQVLRIGTFTFTRDLDGINIDEQLVRDALRIHGYEMNLEFYPGKRLMAQLNNGLIDGDLIRAANLSRGFSNVVRVEEPLIQGCGLIFGLAERTEINLNDPSQTVRVGIYQGVPAAQTKILGAYPSVDFVFFKRLNQGIDLLQHNRIEFIAVSNGQERELKQRVEKPIRLAGGVVLEPAYVHLHVRHTTLAEALAPTMRKMKSVHNIVHCTREDLDARLASKVGEPAASPEI